MGLYLVLHRTPTKGDPPQQQQQHQQQKQNEHQQQQQQQQEEGVWERRDMKSDDDGRLQLWPRGKEGEIKITLIFFS